MANFIKAGLWKQAALLPCKSDLELFAVWAQCWALRREGDSCYQKLFSTVPASMTDTTSVPASKRHSRGDASWCCPVKADLSEQVKGWMMSTVVNVTRVGWPLQRKNMGSNRFPEVNHNLPSPFIPLWTKMFLPAAIKSSCILYQIDSEGHSHWVLYDKQTQLRHNCPKLSHHSFSSMLT